MRTVRQILIEKLKKIFENASGIEMQNVSSDRHFIEIGFDSLLLTQVALNCKKEFGLPVSFRQLNETHSSLELLAGYLEEQMPREELHTKQNLDTNENPSSIRYLSTQIEILARQVADLQKVEKSIVSPDKQIAIGQVAKDQGSATFRRREGRTPETIWCDSQDRKTGDCIE